MHLLKHRLQRKRDSIMDMGKILTLYENFYRSTYINIHVYVCICTQVLKCRFVPTYVCVQ